VTDRHMPAAQQWTAKQDRDDLRLIPPLAEEFLVYGGKDTVERARRWALDGRYVLADGVPSCAHGLYLLESCPGLSTCRNHFRQLDHVNVWVPATPGTGQDRPFLLFHPYDTEISEATQRYAEAHGLDVASFPELGDDWYGHSTIPIRLTIPESWPVWPIEAKAAVLFSTQPIAWPQDDGQ
jgi:hypothetical protein